MNIFKFLPVLFSLSLMAQNKLITNKEAYRGKEGEHQVYYQGGASKFNRITRNEVAIDYLKKTVQNLKTQMQQMQLEVNELNEKVKAKD